MNISTLDQCASCGACLNACPVDAIYIKKDELFYSPAVDAERCVECGKCVSVCPVHGESSAALPRSAYSGWHKQPEIVADSSSGGVFYGFAQKVLENGGVVFGAAFSEDQKEVVFTSTDDVPLTKLQKSKYVESLVGDAFRRIKVELERHRSVLFCGTPCQVAGLKSYLGREYAQLLTCDFACGGLPSHKIYQEYLTILEKKYGAAVEEVDFRPKTHGWKRHAIRVRFQNKREHLRLATEDLFFRGFLYGKRSVRDYCLQCKFPECHAADVTIADFWLHHKLSEQNNPEGISLILCNSDKGCAAVKSIAQQYVMEELDVSAASYNNKRKQVSEKTLEARGAFLRVFASEGLEKAYRQAFPDSVIHRIGNWVTRIIRYKKRGKK